ncbi:hypothetical protein NMG60_11016032 [Bertholletia excelsa]
MVDQQSNEGVSMSSDGGGDSESMVELNIKTLDSQIHSLEVGQSMPISLLKEKIAAEVDLPVEQQRLIFRGKLLKDDHLLSEYHVKNGDTLHLVARQPSDLQSPLATSSEEINANNGRNFNAAGPHNRTGQISHSVVLGTIDVGEHGEGIRLDLSRVIGAVLNSIGIGSQTVTNVSGSVPIMQAPQGNETQVSPNIIGAQNQARTQAQPGQALPNQSSSQASHTPMGAAIPIPSLNASIPDSLRTLTEFINRMELTLSQNGYQLNPSTSDSRDVPTVELPSSAHGLSTPEALIIVLQQAQCLLSDHAVAAISHIAGRLERDDGSTDATVRGQIQTESAHVGLAMQHLGALLLELGRTILTLRMGQSPDTSYVNAGPAVYISSLGPNPIMAQPFPLQTNSGLDGYAGPHPGNLGPAVTGTVPRHLNIHIHTGSSLATAFSALGSRATNADGMSTDYVNQTTLGDSGQIRHALDSDPLSTVVAEVDSQIRNLLNNMQSENQTLRGQSESTSVQSINVGPNIGCNEGKNHLRNDRVIESTVNAKDVPSSSSVGGSSHLNGEHTAVPLASGLGGFQHKPRSPGCDGTSSSTPNQPQQQLLQYLASLTNSTSSSRQLQPGLEHVIGSVPMGGQGALDQIDTTSVMYQQSGIGSTDALRNMLLQFTQNPAMMNTVNCIAQQHDSQDLGNMFPGLRRGQGDGIDSSRMVPQVMPIVSHALGGRSDNPQISAVGPNIQPQSNERSSSSSEKADNQDSEIDLKQVVQRIEIQNPPEEVFRSIVESAADICDSGGGSEDLVNELCGEDLAREFVEVLCKDLLQRLEAEKGSSDEGSSEKESSDTGSSDKS